MSMGETKPADSALPSDDLLREFALGGKGVNHWEQAMAAEILRIREAHTRVVTALQDERDEARRHRGDAMLDLAAVRRALDEAGVDDADEGPLAYLSQAGRVRELAAERDKLRSASKQGDDLTRHGAYQRLERLEAEFANLRQALGKLAKLAAEPFAIFDREYKALEKVEPTSRVWPDCGLNFGGQTKAADVSPEVFDRELKALKAQAKETGK